MVVGVVDQDVEHHEAEQLLGICQMRVALRDCVFQPIVDGISN